MRLLAALLIAALPLASSCIEEAHAQSAGAHVAVVAAQAGAAVGPAFSDSFFHDCTTTASVIGPDTGSLAAGMQSYTCQTPASAETAGTVLVAVGDSAIADPAFATRNSPVYSGDTIREWGGNLKTEYCRADTGTVRIFCRAMVSSVTAP